MEDLAFYNHGCKAVSLLITILANVVIFRLLTRDALGLGSTRPYTHIHTRTHTHTQAHTQTQKRTHTRIKNLFRFNLDALTVPEALVNII